MTFDLTCQACDTSFELDVTDLLDEPRIQCPGCDAKLARAGAEAFSAAVDELLQQVSLLRKRFQIILEVESEDLPPPYDDARARGGDDDEVEGEEGDDEALEEVEEAEADEDDER
jgi:hypothetical protein